MTDAHDFIAIRKNRLSKITRASPEIDVNCIIFTLLDAKSQITYQVLILGDHMNVDVFT
jgi:hypothetical protein